MRSVSDWLNEYGASHSHPVNLRLHWVCVPLIVFSVLGLLWSLPVPHSFARVSDWLNWATLVSVAALVYYCALSWRLAAGMACALAILLLAVQALTPLAWPLWAISLAIFALAWIGQFIGHAFEGRRPSFFRDVQFLLIGPLSLVTKLFARLGLRY